MCNRSIPSTLAVFERFFQEHVIAAIFGIQELFFKDDSGHDVFLFASKVVDDELLSSSPSDIDYLI